MLSRIARQKNGAFLLRHSNRPSNRPSLATPRLHSHSSRPTPIAHTLTGDQHDRPRQPSFQPNRNLATTTDQAAVDQGSYAPFEESPYSVGSEHKPSDKWASLLPGINNEFDTSSLIIMDDYLHTKPKQIRRNVTGMGGSVEDMMANFDVCLKVGHFDRASSFVSRLAVHFPLGSPDYLAVHNRYMEAMVRHMISTREHEMVAALQKWFEVEMRKAKVQPDAATYAIMLKMALRMLDGSHRHRTVWRYWELAKSKEVEEELLAVPVLSELELGELSEICSPDLQRLGLDDIEYDPTNDSQLPTADHNPVPGVRPVEQKGLGLSSLKESLSLFSGQSSVAYPADAGLSAEERKQLYDIKRQRQVEADSIRSAVDRWRTEFEVRQKTGVNSTPGGKRLEPMLTQWFTDMSARIKEELKLIDVAESTPHRLRNVAQKERCSYGVYLRSLEPDKLTAVTILAVMGAFSREGIGGGVKLAVISSIIGKDIQDEMIANAALKKNIAADARRRNILKRILSGRKGKDGRMRWQALVRRMQQEEPMIVWPPAVSAKVGAVLMSLLFEVGKTPAIGGEPGTEGQSEPAFQHSYQITWGRRTGLISIHPAVGQIVTKEPSADFLGRQLPMLCKPRPWTGANEGGYLLYQSHIVRSTPGEALQPKYVRAAMENNGLDHIREGLNVLGTTGWCVNAGVLDVMLEAWNSGEGIGGLAPLEPNLPHPPKPGPEEGYSAELEWDRRMRALENRRSGYHSVRCFQNFQLEVARAYRNEEFYLPHNLDFRGRAYPLPPYLNQMGADNARGLLLFSEAKPLGERGLRWLKVHIANLVGFDKASISEREQFTMDHLDDIIDSAEKGLHGRRWWLEAEDPWQCLAACIELKNALDQVDPTQFMSRLPIHQDGSCNGLQHYAALGGDTIGAQQVNLEPSDRPSDVYTGVSDFVQEEVARDAAIGNPTARMLQGRITRRVVKQTVMTNVYGVTFMGAMKQVRRQLKDQYPDMEEEDVKGCAMYVARKIFGALSRMFNGAHEIQHWLGDCASRITQSMSPEQIEDLANDALTGEKKSPRVNASSGPRTRKKDPTEAFKSTVIWTSPLGLPVVQPYWTRRARRIMTSLQDLSVLDATTGGVVARRKQLQAFPPNFIHSLDATHMMLSATACRKVGVTFSAVHDSFWTHANDVDSMNDILREAFVRMHSDDVVQRLAEEFKVRYGNNLFLAKIEKSSKIGKAVQALRKEKKTNRTIELLEEYKRQKLLKSDDPELQAQGRAMRTSAAVFEELGGSNDDLTLVTSLGQTDIGHRQSMQADSRSLADEGEGEGELAGAAQDVVDDIAPEAGATKETRKKKPDMYLWLPMFFSEVPAKGEWDLTRIRESQYFFS